MSRGELRNSLATKLRRIGKQLSEARDPAEMRRLITLRKSLMIMMAAVNPAAK